MDETALLDLIAEIVAGETGSRRPPRLMRSTRAADVPGWDSLIHARIVLALEERLRCRIDIARTYELADLGALADYLAALATGHA